MASILHKFLHLKLCSPVLTLPNNFPKRRVSVRSSSSSCSLMASLESASPGRKKLMEFPHVSIPHKDIMVELITAVEATVGSQLLPCSVPSDVEYYQNESGSSQATLQIRSGTDSSPIDFILESWVHLELPTGGALDITNLQGYLKNSTDAPHFQFELVQCTPTFFIFFCDITPRKDLVLHPDYLKTYYEETQLEQQRVKIDKLPQTKPYFSSSLYFRRVISPTGIMVSIECKQQEGVEDILREHIRPVAKEVFEIWVDKCVVGGEHGEVLGEAEKSLLTKRDRLIKSRAVEMDLSSNLPKQFGDDVANRVLRVIRDVFKIN